MWSTWCSLSKLPEGNSLQLLRLVPLKLMLKLHPSVELINVIIGYKCLRFLHWLRGQNRGEEEENAYMRICMQTHDHRCWRMLSTRHILLHHIQEFRKDPLVSRKRNDGSNACLCFRGQLLGLIFKHTHTQLLYTAAGKDKTLLSSFSACGSEIAENRLCVPYRVSSISHDWEMLHLFGDERRFEAVYCSRVPYTLHV